MSSRRRRGEPIEDYFDRAVIKQPTGCWLFPQIDVTSGYAVLHVRALGPGNLLIHRWSYEHHVGPIPDGHQIDHLCHTADTACPGGRDCPHRRCVNPRHLEPVTITENVLRGRGPLATNKRKTHCSRGHEFTPENTYRYSKRPGTRACKRCQIETQRLRRAGLPIEGTTTA